MNPVNRNLEYKKEEVIIINSDEDDDVIIVETEDILKPKYLEGEQLLNHLEYSNGKGACFDELIEKKYLRKALLTSFVIDFEWLLSKLPKEANKVIVFHENKSEGTMSVLDNMLLINPKVEGGIMHAKLMLLFYDSFLRMVIGSANLISYDWEVLENIFYVHDLPLLDEKEKITAKPNNFQNDLKQFLIDLMIPSKVYNTLDDFDFSMIKVDLITSCPYPTNGSIKQGLSSLSSKLHSHYPPNIILESKTYYQCSSIGSLNPHFTNRFLHTLYPTTQDKELKIVFPSLDTVNSSKFGIQGGGSIFFPRTYKPPKNVKDQLLHDSISLRAGVLSHCKTIYGILKVNKSSSLNNENDPKENEKISESKSQDEEVFWFYLGSHNFSYSAWGNLNILDDTKGTKTKNYELGILTCQNKNLIPYLFPPPIYNNLQKPWQQTLAE